MQNKMRYCLLLLLATFLFVSCTRETQKKLKQGKALAGTWNVDKIERTYYKNSQPDSTVTISDAGSFQLTYYKEETLNDCWFSFGTVNPASMMHLPEWGGNLTGFPCHWEFDAHTTDRITFWSASIYVSDPFVIFNRTNRKKNSEVWTYVEASSITGISLREVYYVSNMH